MFKLRKEQPKYLTQTGKVLRALKDAGHYGMANYELDRICLSWHRRIGDLRAEGHNIACVRITRGTFKYFLTDEQ